MEVDDSDKEDAAQHKYRDNNGYAKFPFRCKSMKELEECGDNCIIMEGLNGEGLPLTDCPFTYKPNIGNVAGMISHSLDSSTKLDAELELSSSANVPYLETAHALPHAAAHDHAAAPAPAPALDPPPAQHHAPPGSV